MTEQSGSRVAQAQQDQQNSPERALWAAEGHIAAILPSHLNAKSWIGVAIGALKRDDKLYQVAMRNPGSLMSAMLRAAQDGLRPGTEEFYLIPYGQEVQGIRGYQGELALIYRGGAVASVTAEIVYANDKFEYQPGSNTPPKHTVDYMAPRGEMRLAYAFAHMVEGGISNVIVMPEAEIHQHRAASPSYKNDRNGTSPWNKWPKSMWLKTTVHELQKWVPTSAEYIRDKINAAAAVQLEQVRSKALATAQSQLGLPQAAAPVRSGDMAGLDGSGPAPQAKPEQASVEEKADKKTGEISEADKSWGLEEPPPGWVPDESDNPNATGKK